MNKEEIPNIARTVLSEHLLESGSILYSSHETLKRGKVYLLGFNPGGSEAGTLKQSIDELLTTTDNAYLDQQWENHISKWDAGKAPLQERVQWVLNSLCLDPKEVCASNLIFIRSRKAIDIDYSLGDVCWPVHEAILQIVKPEMILAFGNSGFSPYHYLYSRFGEGQETHIPAGHGNWSLKHFTGNIGGKKCLIKGLPHLSRYSPKGKDHVVSWLKSTL